MFQQFPFNHLHRDFDSIFSEFSRLLADKSVSADAPRINVWCNDDETLVRAEVPGVDPEAIEISVHENQLRIGGDRSPSDAGTDESMTWHRNERLRGKFSRTVTLPYRVNADAVTAECRHGILTIRLQREEADKPRQIKVKAA
jgi:HSP20 family protein